MARVTELLSSLGVAEDGISTAYPETFVDDISGAYGEDTAAYEAKIAVLTADLAEAQEKVLALQAHNYELMTSVSAPVVEGENEDEKSGDEDKPADSDDNSGVDSLFNKKKDED